MVNGLYTATRGMTNILAKQDAHAQNLANATSAGFKLSRVVNETQVAIGRNDLNQLHQDENQGISGRYTSFAQGPLIKTGNDLDFALTSSGFFMIEGEDGPRYTRNGTFSMNSYGELVTMNGRRVLDESGSPVQLRGEGSVQIMEDGGLFKEGRQAARLAVVDFADNNLLLPGAEGLFTNSQPDRNPAAPRRAGGHQAGIRGRIQRGSHLHHGEHDRRVPQL